MRLNCLVICLGLVACEPGRLDVVLGEPLETMLERSSGVDTSVGPEEHSIFGYWLPHSELTSVRVEDAGATVLELNMPCEATVSLSAEHVVDDVKVVLELPLPAEVGDTLRSAFVAELERGGWVRFDPWSSPRDEPLLERIRQVKDRALVDAFENPRTRSTLRMTTTGFAVGERDPTIIWIVFHIQRDTMGPIERSFQEPRGTR